jgi:hypothetical protein
MSGSRCRQSTSGNKYCYIHIERMQKLENIILKQKEADLLNEKDKIIAIMTEELKEKRKKIELLLKEIQLEKDDSERLETKLKLIKK